MTNLLETPAFTKLVSKFMDHLEGLEKAQAAQTTLTQQLLQSARDLPPPTPNNVLSDEEEDTVQMPELVQRSDTPERPRRSKVYAVARGRETGVFDGSEWKRVTKAVSHYSGARYKKFTGSRATALAWDWLECNGIPRIEADLSDSDSIPTQVTQVVFDEAPNTGC
jgi:hypothetical protein